MIHAAASDSGPIVIKVVDFFPAASVMIAFSGPLFRNLCKSYVRSVLDSQQNSDEFFN